MSEIIRKSVKAIAGRAANQVTVCKVLSVDKAASTCDCEPVTGEADFADVRLRATIDNKTVGAVIFPVVGSTVLVALIGTAGPFASAAYVAQYSEIDEVWIENGGGMSLKVKPGVIALNGESYSLIKDDELKSELDKINRILQALLQIIGGAPIAEPGSGNPSAFQQTLNGAVAGLQLPDYANILNEKVKHG